MAIKTGFHHVALKVPNFDEALAFYTEVIGLKIRAQWPGAALLQLDDGGHLELFAGTEPIPADVNCGYFHFAFKVDDVDAAMELAMANGAPLKMAAKDAQIGDLKIRCGFVYGPGGESVEFFKEI